MFDDFFAKAQELSQAGEFFATAMVVRAERPTSGKPGDKAIVTRDGSMYGWIGGSCAQPAVIEHSLAALKDHRSRLIRITPDPGSTPPDGIQEVQMTCFSGGTIDVYIEPQEPQPRLIVVGHLPVAKALVHLGKAMSYHTLAVDPETDGAGLSDADEVLTDLDDLPDKIHELTYVVVATHGHYDEPALEKALGAGAGYVGLISSPKRSKPIIEHLRRQGFGDEELAALHAPAGLDLGSRRGDEIALSILAEIVQLRRQAEKEAAESAKARKPEPEESDPETATDPICSMSVRIEGARHTYEHDGTTYYFCCGGCRAKFMEDPEQFLAA